MRALRSKMTTEEYMQKRKELKGTILWEPIDAETFKLKVEGGYLYRTVMVLWAGIPETESSTPVIQQNVTFVPELLSNH